MNTQHLWGGLLAIILSLGVGCDDSVPSDADTDVDADIASDADSIETDIDSGGGDADGERDVDEDSTSNQDGDVDFEMDVDTESDADPDVEESPPPECRFDEDCADEVFCNGNERCVDGECVDGRRRDCNDLDLCTDDACNEPTRSCVHKVRDRDDDGHIDVTCLGDDCFDGDPLINPDAEERCNGLDDDCDGDCDNGFECCAGEVEECEGSEPGHRIARTCSDGCSWGPCLVLDICNGVDDDEDGEVDEGCACRDGWALVRPSPPAFDLRESWTAPDDGSVYFVGERGTIVRYDHRSLEVIDAGISGTLLQISGTSSNNIFVYQSGGIIHHFDGTSWDIIFSDPDYSIYGFSTFSDDLIFAAGAYDDDWSTESGRTGVVLRYHDSGWEEFASFPDTSIRQILAYSERDIRIVGSRGLVMRYNGIEWIDMSFWPGYEFISLTGTGTSSSFLFGWSGEAGSGGWVHFWNFDGFRWTIVPTLDSYEYPLIGDAWAVADDDAVVVIRDDIYRVNSASGLLEFVTSDVPQEVIFSEHYPRLGTITGSSPRDVFIVGEGGVILRNYTGDMTHWESVVDPYLFGVDDIMLAGSNSFYFLGSIGLWSYDGYRLESISPHTLDPYDTQKGWAFGEDDIFVTNWSSILHFDGIFWHTTLPSDVFGRIWFHDLFGTSAGEVFAVGSHETVVRYDGESWAQMETPCEDSAYNHIWGTSEDNIYISPIGFEDECCLVHYDGASWEEVEEVNRLETRGAIWGSSEDDVYVVGEHVAHFDGRSWSAVDVGYPDTTEFNDIWGSSSTDVYLLGCDSYKYLAIYHYDGEIWSREETPDLPCLVTISGTSSNNVIAAGRWNVVIQKCVR